MDAAVEARLIAAARGGDLNAYGKLVDAHQPAVRAFLRRLTGNAADADDIAQEAFARTWEILQRFEGASSLRTFICGVGFQYWRRARRSNARRIDRDLAYGQAEALQETIEPDADVRATLRKAMDALSDEQRAAVALCIGGAFTHPEAAAVLNLPLGTVKSHVARGLARLQSVLGVIPRKNADE